MEAYNQLILATDLNYIDKKDLDLLQPQVDIVARLLNGLRASLIKKLNEK